MDEIERKRKNEHVVTYPGEKFLWAVLGVLALFFWLAIRLWTANIDVHNQPSPFYTLTLWLRIGSVLVVLIISFGGLVLALLTGAMHRGARGRYVLLTCVMGVPLFLMTLYCLGIGSIILPLQTLSYRGHMYRLLHVEYSAGEAAGIAYTVIECDEQGVNCRYYATPILEEGMEWYNPYKDDWGASAVLMLNESDQQLYLQSRGSVYPMIRRCGWYAEENKS